MPDFKIRALEIHSAYAWDFNFVKKTIDFMRDNQLNTLIFHKNDFLEWVTFPVKYFGGKRDSYDHFFERYQDIFRALKKYTPTRKNAPLQKRSYFTRVLEEARRAGIEVFIENKELYFPDIILEFFPHLVKEGKTCPSDPFWLEFVGVKYREFFEDFPAVSGIITSPASGESRATISYTRCTCDRCRNTSPEEWYVNLINAIHAPLAEAGKKLIIRDFVFDSKNHEEISAAMERLPNEIGYALKNTPHDYFPTFPDNARIGHVGDREQWIEFDVWGQFTGWGVSPSILIDDLKHRLAYAKERGAEGVMFRIDWEHLDGHSAFNTLNIINIYAAAELSRDMSVPNVDIYKLWLEKSGYYAADADEQTRERAAAWIGGIMDQTWNVVKGTAYINDFVFSDSSHWPLSMEIAHWLAEDTFSLEDWDASKVNPLGVGESNVRFILKEKDEALRLVRSLSDQLQVNHEGLSAQALQYLRDCFVPFVKYVEAFRLVTYNIILAKHAVECREQEGTPFYVEALRMLDEKRTEMRALERDFEQFFLNTSYMYRAYTLLDPARLRSLDNDLNRYLAQLEASTA